MLKKSITYVDYNGETRTEDFYFNLTKAEIIDMELSVEGGMSEYYKRILSAKDIPELIKVFKDLIKKSYGVKSADGKRFIKNEEVYNEFVQCPAYSELFTQIAMDADGFATEFVEGIMPKDLDNLVKNTDGTN